MSGSYKKFIQFLLFPILYFPYKIINEKYIVKWLGCACPKVGADGTIIRNNFNANDFTLLFWGVIGLIVITISVLNLKKIPVAKAKFVYIIQVILGVMFIILWFFSTMKWK